jgi:hypothetical protein
LRNLVTKLYILRCSFESLQYHSKGLLLKMKRLLIVAATLLLLQAACSLPAALGMASVTSLTQTVVAPASGIPAISGPAAQDNPADGREQTSTAAPDAAPVATADPRITFLLAQLRLYLATNPHIHKVGRLAVTGSTLDLEITTVYPGQSDQAGVAYETARAIAGGLSLAPKDQVDALMQSGEGTLHLRVNSSDSAYHFVSDTPLPVLAALQAGQVSEAAWMAASKYQPVP